MSKCRQCRCDIPRGKIFKGELYKSLSFCSESCYNEYIQAKQTKPKQAPKDRHLVKLKDYINMLWDEQVNWPLIMKQIKSMKEEYNLDSKGLYLVLKYATVYEDYVVDRSFGLGQFVKFIEPAQRFAEQIQRSKELAEEMPEEEIVYVKPHKQRVWLKEEDWDD